MIRAKRTRILRHVILLGQPFQMPTVPYVCTQQEGITVTSTGLQNVRQVLVWWPRRVPVLVVAERHHWACGTCPHSQQLPAANLHQTSDPRSHTDCAVHSRQQQILEYILGCCRFSSANRAISPSAVQKHFRPPSRLCLNDS